jgi:hypothetical protein
MEESDLAAEGRRLVVPGDDPTISCARNYAFDELPSMLKSKDLSTSTQYGVTSLYGASSSKPIFYEQTVFMNE